ncbi:MAG TPA: hypothetical protein VM099_04380 [Gemmatimonadaceae bacterium]|nr:hypothetical protein [Gemmatimonadaceae bacterium]
MIKRLGLLAALISALACTKTPVSANTGDTETPGGSVGSGAPAGTQQGDWDAILKLEAEAKAIAKTSGCTASECRSAPVGSRGCGGPRYYIPYCSKSTDSVALFKKLDQVAAAEKAYNIKYKIGSTCEFRMPPLVESVGGVCTAR